MYRGKGKCTQYFGENTIRGHLEYLGVTGRVILKYTYRETQWRGMDWINLAQDRVKWQAVANMVMDL